MRREEKMGNYLKYLEKLAIQSDIFFNPVHFLKPGKLQILGSGGAFRLRLPTYPTAET